jgi:hypothetical protein
LGDQNSNQIKREEVIQWLSRTRRSNVPIVEVNSLSALRIRSFSNPRVILMSPNAVPNAVRQGKHSGTETMATAIDPHAKCSLQYAPIVARKLKYRSSHAKTDRYIAVIASVK